VSCEKCQLSLDFRQEDGLINAITRRRKFELSPEHIVTVLFTGNFIGILFCRSLLWRTRFHTSIRMLLLSVIEVIWNIFPSHKYSSFALLIAHMAVMYGLIAAPLEHSNQPKPSETAAASPVGSQKKMKYM